MLPRRAESCEPTPADEISATESALKVAPARRRGLLLKTSTLGFESQPGAVTHDHRPEGTQPGLGGHGAPGSLETTPACSAGLDLANKLKNQSPPRSGRSGGSARREAGHGFRAVVFLGVFFLLFCSSVTPEPHSWKPEFMHHCFAWLLAPSATCSEKEREKNCFRRSNEPPPRGFSPPDLGFSAIAASALKSELTWKRNVLQLGSISTLTNSVGNQVEAYNKATKHGSWNNFR